MGNLNEYNRLTSIHLTQEQYVNPTRMVQRKSSEEAANFVEIDFFEEIDSVHVEGMPSRPGLAGKDYYRN